MAGAETSASRPIVGIRSPRQTGAERRRGRSHRYLGMYLTVAAVVVLGVLVSAGLYLQQRRDARHRRAPARHPRWTLAPGEPPS